ncbi:MAG: hypothetical protein NTX86_01500 [Candidatus Dependentiae bacterium]|nr:hypothetical protein [Candidatus Dependentiae bacterium]
MQSNALFSKFSQGLSWNAISYVAYKLAATMLSFFLYARLTTQDFSTWVNINSLIFLLLLWIDFGFRKSIPRFSPEFAKNKESQERFIRYILLFQAAILLVTVPLYVYLATRMTQVLHLVDHATFFYCGVTLFAMEGIVAVLRLIYHAHFWNKQFNLMQMAILSLEMAANLGIVFIYKDSTAILTGIFITKICSGFLTNTLAIAMLTRLYKDKNYPGNQTIDFNSTMRAFIKHSGIMWFNTNTKSLSERNFLVPLFTHIFGPATANLFKVANDGALFFHRIVLKTIGTNDTALLAHVKTLPDRDKLMPIAFTKLTSKITSLCIPILGFLAILWLKRDILFHNPFVLQAFFVMIGFLLMELLLSPYERILEINQRYWLLALAYAPYLCMLMVPLYSSTYITALGLLVSLSIIHIVRLISASIMVYCTWQSYPLLTFPVKHTLILITMCMPLCFLGYFIVTLYPIILMYVRSRILGS